MKKSRLLLGAFCVAALSLHARAGSLSYVAIPPTGSDAGSGISSDNTYTSAVNGGNTTGADRVVNGAPLAALVGSGGSSSAGNVTFTAATGSLANAGGANANIAADGVLLNVLSTATFVHGADADSAHTITLDPASLAAGTTYDLRVYIGGWSGQNRVVNLTFSGDGQAPVGTDFFNEDDATSSAGGFATANQVYYIDYQYTWDGSTTPTITITQKDPAIPFHLYALTNQVVGAPAAAPQAQAGPAPEPVADNDIGNVSSDQFYTPLQSSGEWVSVSGYGNCWHPSGVSEDWRPYTNGYWAQTDCGWTWVSNEPWGWATYHYGRWTHVEDEGWVWVPGRVWAPAWVSWRYGHDAVGWAPLPPSARFSPGIGISIWADRSYDIGPSSYNFCPVERFGSPNLAAVIYPRERNATFISNTTNITNISYNRNNTTVYNGGPNLAAVNAAITRHGGRPVPTLVLNRQQTATPAGGKFSQVHGNQLSLVAPRVIPAAKAAALPKIAKTIAAPKIDHGWSGIKDPKVAAQLKAKVAGEAKGKTPQNTHAQLPQAAALAKPAATSGAKGSAFFQKTGVTPAATPRAGGKVAHTPAPAATAASAPKAEKNSLFEHFNTAPTPAPAPAVEHTPAANAEAFHTPKPEVVHTPKPEVVHTPKPEVVHTPKPEVVHTPKPEAVHTPKPEVVHTPKPEVVHTPKPEVVHTPKPEVVHTPKPEVVHTPKPEVVHTPKPEVVHTPKPEAVHAPTPKPKEEHEKDKKERPSPTP